MLSNFLDILQHTNISKNTRNFLFYENPFLYRLIGGDERIRTADPLRAKQVLYQLSYIPTIWGKMSFTSIAMT